MVQLKDVDKRHKSFVINILLLNFCNCLIHSNIAAPTKSFFKVLCLQFVSFKIFSYLCSVFEMHRKRNFGERKRRFSSEKRGRGDRDSFSRRGRPYCYPPSEGLGEVVCPKNERGIREVVRQKGTGVRSCSGRHRGLPLPRRVEKVSSTQNGAMLQCERSIALY